MGQRLVLAKQTVFLQMLGCLPMVVLSLTPWMAESPRWLVKKNRRADALKVLADLHANGDESEELVVNEMAEIVSAVDLDTQIVQTGFSDFVKTPGNRKRLWSIVWFAWALSMSGVSFPSPFSRNFIESGLRTTCWPTTRPLSSSPSASQATSKSKASSPGTASLALSWP